VAGGDELGERQRVPAAAPRAVRGELVMVLLQARVGADIDPGEGVGSSSFLEISHVRSNSAFRIALLRRTLV
jgi:hypothetical protein